MKYVSIDLETTGLETENHQILSIGAVIEDTLDTRINVEDLPTFHGVIVHNELTGSPFALNMNRDLIEKIQFNLCYMDGWNSKLLKTRCLLVQFV
jgi:oligoribonuclease